MSQCANDTQSAERLVDDNDKNDRPNFGQMCVATPAGEALLKQVVERVCFCALRRAGTGARVLSSSPSES